MVHLNIQKRWAAVFAMLFTIWSVTACKKDAPLPDNLAAFESDNLGLSESAENIDIKMRLSRATDRDISVVVQMIPEGVEYTTDFTTVPAASGNNVTLIIPNGSNETNLKVVKSQGALFDGDEKIVFKILSVSEPAVLGTVPELTLSFAEIVSDAGTMTLNGGGSSYGNKVFVDLSANKQTAIERTKWDLGFSSGDDFRVILNSSTGMMARALEKNDLNEVTAADTTGFEEEMSFNAFSTDALAYIDYPDGDPSRTAIAAISATAAENKVYIINMGTGIGSPAPSRGWKKIRVLRNESGGYTLQHADIGATSFSELQVSKSADHFFAYASFENGTVDVEPEKTKWDIAWTYFTNVTPFGGDEIPYTFQDFVLQNQNVGSAIVMNSTATFDNFGESGIDGLTFNTGQNSIGADWRSGGGPNTAPAIRTDRFYVIKDADGNYYKLKFTSLTRDGERGYPSFEYALVKRGNP